MKPAGDMRAGREFLTLLAFAVVVAGLLALGIGARATYGAQTTADEPQYLLSALSLWEDGDLDIADELADERYRDFHEVDLPEQTLLLEDGTRVSPHDPLLPLLLAAPMGLWGWVGAKTTLAILGGVLAALIVWTARHRLGISARTAYVTTALFALAPPLAVYSTQVYPEIPAALAVTAGFAAILGPFNRTGRIVLVAAVVVLPWLAVKYVPVAAVLAIAGLVKAGKGRRVGLVFTFAVAAALYFMGHLLIYEGATAYSTGDHFVGGEFTAVGSDPDLWGRSTRLIGLLVDGGFGIGAWQPAFLLLPLVAGWAVTGKNRERFGIAVALLLTGWLVATFVALTMHGWWFPGRQVVVVLPMAVLLTAAWVDQSPRRRAILVTLGSLGVIAFGFLVVEGLRNDLTWVVDFGATANPFYQTLASALPDYMTPTAVTWALHGLWVVAVVALASIGWRTGSFRDDTTQTPDFNKREDQERVLT